MNKSLGQIAYEAYCEHTNWKSLVNGATLPRWEEVKPEIKAAWEDSALTVANVTIKFGNWVGNTAFNEVIPKNNNYLERKVVE